MDIPPILVVCKGVDIWAAQIVIRHRAQYPNIKPISAMPYPGFGAHWLDGWAEAVPEYIGRS